MVAALFTLTAGMERAGRQRKAAGTLSLLQLIADRGAICPSEIADLHEVHPSLITSQVRELEDAGQVQVAADPADGRAARRDPADAAERGRRRAAGP
jgi:DNA-binding MarR family transcriptional regulator